MDIIILFTSYYFANKIDRILTEQRIEFTLIAVPPEISSACGMAIRIKPDRLDIVQEIMTSHHISPSHIYWYRKGEEPRLYKGKKET